MGTPADLAEPQAVSPGRTPGVLRPTSPRPHLALDTHLRQGDFLGPLLRHHLVVQVLADPEILLLIPQGGLQLPVLGAQLLLLPLQLLGPGGESGGGEPQGPGLRSTPSLCPRCAPPSNPPPLWASGCPV